MTITVERVQPFPYQKDGVRAIESFGGRALLADDMGLGKTLQVLHYIRRNPDALPAVVVCPASVKYHWERQALCQIGMQATVLEGQTPRRDALRGLVQHKLIVINYDILKPWLPYILALNPKLLVIDECQNIGNPTAKRTKSVIMLGAYTPHIIATSGTPMESRPRELYPTVSLIAPHVFPSATEFYMRYCAPERKPWGWTYDGATHIPELRRKLLENLMIRRRFVDVSYQLPVKTRRILDVDIANREEYDEARRDFLGWLARTGGVEAAKRAARAEQIVQVNYLRMAAARGKVRAIVEWADHFLATTDEKLCLFGVHTKMLEALQRRYAGQCVLVNGEVTGRARDEAIQRFIHDARCRVFIGNIRACGTGIDGLQRVCRVMGVVEMDWNPGKHIQLEGRLARIGQAERVWIYYLIARDTIETRLCRAVQEKQGVFNAIMDGEGGGEDFNILDMLMEWLAQGDK